MSSVSLNLITANKDSVVRQTKIVCTLGPACWSEEGLGQLIDCGMNCARLNFSHGDHTSHAGTLERLRKAIALRPGCQVSVMLDTKGPEIRTGVVDPTLGGKVKFTKGDIIEVGTDYTAYCNASRIACSYKSLPKSVTVGSKILVADGVLSLEVVEVLETSVKARVLNNASFGDRKNMNLPGAIVDLPTLTEKDIDDLVNFGVHYNVDCIAASFVRKGSDIDFIREVLGPKGAHIKIIAKIENLEGLENYDDILEKTDGIMVARGDLGMEIPLQKVFLAQKMMIDKANIVGRPVITATQMLESMITNPRPTRAECADVANAVLNGTDSVMLSGESANGEYPNDAVMMMSNTCVEAESSINYDAEYQKIRGGVLAVRGKMSPAESVGSSAVKTAIDIGASIIVVVTESGIDARLVAKYRPSIPIIVVTSNAATARQAQGLLRNCKSLLVDSIDQTRESVDNVVLVAAKFGQELGYCKAGDSVVAVHQGVAATALGNTSVLRVFSL